MAVDTRAKRLSMLNFGHGSLLPDPNTSGVDASERATFLNLYSGIALDNPAPVLVVGGGIQRRLPRVTVRETCRGSTRGSTRLWGL